MILLLCRRHFLKSLQNIVRCGIGIGNYVWLVKYCTEKYIIRCSEEQNAYENTVFWLERLGKVEVPVPTVIAKGVFQGLEYLILSYMEGKDLGLVYQESTSDEKKRIAVDVINIQTRVPALDLRNVEENWKWESFIRYILTGRIEAQDNNIRLKSCFSVKG